MAITAEVERLRSNGEVVVDLSTGEPDFTTPDHVKIAAKMAIDANFTKYTTSRGIPELRDAVCVRYREDYGINVQSNEVLITAGGKQALFNAALALFDSGDEVITHAPYWPTLPEQVRLAGAKPVIVSTSTDKDFMVDGAEIISAITPRTRAIIINSPGNPTGATISESAATLIAKTAAAHGIWILADLCYEQIIYDDIPHNLPEILLSYNSERTVLVGSASKSYAMTGWRCGWSIAPSRVTSAMNAIQSQATSHVTSIVQKAALEAISGPQNTVNMMRDEYRVRRDRMHEWLTTHPSIQFTRPAGAFYMFPNIKALLSASGVSSSIAFTQRLLDEERVAVTPGEVFGAPGHIRICYATSLGLLRKGADRILRFANALE
jgi:aspartate aminotransferase